jgi:hypothetical protein
MVRLGLPAEAEVVAQASYVAFDERPLEVAIMTV